jgi:DNA-binding response OmpR family regulator
VLRIRALARRQPAARAVTLQAAGIALDTVDRTVTRDGRPINVSVKEFGALEALLRASPGFVSAEDLLEQVWDKHADPFTNTVMVTSGRLRRELGQPPAIKTTPGVGYQIACPEQRQPGCLRQFRQPECLRAGSRLVVFVLVGVVFWLIDVRRDHGPGISG